MKSLLPNQKLIILHYPVNIYGMCIIDKAYRTKYLNNLQQWKFSNKNLKLDISMYMERAITRLSKLVEKV